MTRPRRLGIAAVIGFVVLVADQITKFLALEVLQEGPVAVLPVFNLTLVYNRGVTFGLFSDSPWAGPVFLAVMSLIVVVVLLIWLWRVARPLPVYAIGLIAGGAIGNIIDRLRFGAVVDFLDFHIGDWHYPAFNIADSGIVLGIAILLFDSLFLEPGELEAGKNDTDKDDKTDG